MRALIMQKDRTIQFGEVPKPVPGKGEVLIKVEACGICGTDMHVYRGMESAWSLPGVIGHEFSGIVEMCGGDCEEVKLGDSVTVQPLISCGNCPRCREGRTNLCENVRLIGGELPGAFAEWVIVPKENVIRVPSKLPVKYGALAEPAATAVHAVKRLRRSSYDTVLIKGAGAIGLLILCAVRELAKTIIVSDIDEGRLEVARELGADRTINPRKQDLAEELADITGQMMADVVFDAAGEKGGKEKAFELVHPGSEIVFVALGNAVAEIDFTKVVTQELSIYGTQCHTKSDFEEALKLMERGQISYEKIVTELPLEKGSYAFEHPSEGIKIHLFP